MLSLNETPLLAAAAHLDRPAVICDGGDWTWRDVHAAALALAQRLDDGSTVCNLCNSRVGFLVTWLAALRRGCLQLLPPSGGHADLVAILKSVADPVIVVDDAKLLQPHWAEHARCLVHLPQAKTSAEPDAALAWNPDLDSPLLRLYTSGSTGTPEPQIKTLGQFARGAQVLATRLDQDVEGGLAALGQIICSVPPQHMFGVETSVMLSLVAAVPVVDRRPLLPADVHAAFERCVGDAAWIATPLHLRALAQSGMAVPHCRLVLVSTMPLAPALAAQAESLARAPVLEIYGSTETGVVAMRRGARDPRWRPVHGVRLESEGTGTRVWGTHFTSPQMLADQVELDAQGGFDLIGRHGDLIKIAGRRASLAGLNLLLQDLPGLADGVLYLPATGAPTERLVLIHAGPPLDRAATEAWLRERMDPVFLPRTIIRVDRLPRTESGKLPRAALDQIYADRSPKRKLHEPR
ncbi:AMP-binding protein [Caenimonas soli]|uniref:AMP-binding protein n=1 Tax=Caenimonas soli TaxID=2735555 RepID=UPI0015559940|nr:AMP-binding protein [Caenimonas soli]NPC57957.1 acyl-CoA synthetase [Caenimonas soli]